MLYLNYMANAKARSTSGFVKGEPIQTILI